MDVLGLRTIHDLSSASFHCNQEPWARIYEHRWLDIADCFRLFSPQPQELGEISFPETQRYV